ncbi:alkanesulfonate monooxygenase SsuD/methylene tetrahydromethanopterin reductase-like flavin-dependent oxidoreductase (luciferase family) [Saccharothrix tamanrassetensis]|uniref:Alkanesulfonate monooxygenase SsuD/methylene tetrahydromethanopterin reductase-like flavin-dependent oxidoreductase (Luciferase family) n=1 Tax=Saccharothrix tamanrassetensis TaxID=1051531 RepID=A0A841CIM2_9PSEU|nr:LLM class flavin-dependent oxidoreductase [Saccharothrix tamanrassetensis]MBB5956880.1 alkanesulfonate monooxygenase SsuD/methylene tetrahydromethanopterin reductase-like flavin-dependent oxidoreductase (luciferase family) [Saccharothrix tamanrassetensis]
MDVYLLILGDHLPDPNSGRVVSEAERLRAIVEQAVVAEEAGFTGVAIGEHHFTKYIVSAPELLLATIAERTTTLRLSTGVTLLAHHDPVRVAEELAMLDVLSGGRAEMIVARGVSQRTDLAFGVRDDLRERFDENLRLLLRLLADPHVTWTGRFRSPLVDVTTTPRPLQRPRPPVWIGSGSAVSADLAVELGLPLMLPSTLRDPSTHRAVVERYRTAMDGRGRVALPSHVFVAPTASEARGTWRPHLEAYARFADPWRGDGDADVAALMDGAAVCGDPVEVTDRLNHLGELLGLDAQLVMVDIGGLPHSAVLDTIRLFGAEVLPNLKP